MTIYEHLAKISACKEAREWASSRKTGKQCWDECERINWLFWWTAKEGQYKQVAEVSQKIADSVKHLNNKYASYVASYAAYASYAAADADASYVAAAASYVAAYAADAAAYAADAADAYASYAAAYKQQKELNMQIARSILVCPFPE